jgi:hypothetical protein
MSHADTPTPAAVNKAEIKRGRTFEPGQRGNPSGRPIGSRNRVSRAVEDLIHGQAEALGAKAVKKALKGAGDAIMLRALLNTLVPPRRDRAVEFELPKIETAADALRRAPVLERRRRTGRAARPQAGRRRARPLGVRL